ncbi:MAG: type IV pilus twitching motility protein PilT [Oscillospiraceae bacterium]|jgi:twitching motility protein PilT|nr:type IV pilus twitching motility protein PilT [Oscillospiraceae bacterium]
MTMSSSGVTVHDLLVRAVKERISDLFITAGSPIMFKTDGEIRPADSFRMMPKDTALLIEEIFRLSGSQAYDDFLKTGDCDFSFSLPGVGRFRINAFRQRNSMAAVIRVVQLSLADADALGIPPAVLELHKKTKGLILVTGPAGSGKSTTLASLIDLINSRRNCHILTLEDPIEYLHTHKMSVVNQREIESDTTSYAKALRAALRQSPDVILVGEMRDHETISIALTAAETGHLVLSTLHTVGAAKTVDRVIDVFPPNQQQQVRIQLSTVLQAVVSQQLLPSPVKGRAAVFEVMLVNAAIRSLIREGKVHQLDTVIQTAAAAGMQGMDHSLAEAAKEGLISREDAFTFCVNAEILSKYI